MLKRFIKLVDILIILAVTALTVTAAYMIYMRPSSQSMILVRGQNGEWTFPVNAEETIIVQGPLGDTTVRFHGNKAWIESSPCDNQTCVAAGSVSKQGQWTACLPNNVLLLIHGVEDDSVDGIVW